MSAKMQPIQYSLVESYHKKRYKTKQSQNVKNLN